jgi:hypothetical protein
MPSPRRSRDASKRSRATRSSPTTSRSRAARPSTQRSPHAILEPNVVLTALDSDVIKTYVELGDGRRHHGPDGLRRVEGPAFESLDAAICSRHRPTRLALRRGVLPEGYTYASSRCSRRSTTAAAIDRRSQARARLESF